MSKKPFKNLRQDKRTGGIASQLPVIIYGIVAPTKKVGAKKYLSPYNTEEYTGGTRKNLVNTGGCAMGQKMGKTGEKGFEVSLNRPRKLQDGHRESRAGQSFLQQVDRLSKGGRLSGSVARGRVAGRGAFVRTPMKAAQRVVVKGRIVAKLRGSQNKSLLKAHLTYISRDGAGENEEKAPKLYNEKGEISQSELSNWTHETAQDRHHFRFIISPEKARGLDLSSYTKEVVGKMERDLGTKLSYVAANHYNTDNPHAHVIIRGKDDAGRDLVIAKDYMSNGIRNRASEVATRHLGYRSELEIRAGVTSETTKERFTLIDQDLIKAQANCPENLIDTTWRRIHERSFAAFKRNVQIARLKELKKMGLASEVMPGKWRLKEGVEATLRGLGERGDIIKTLHKALKNEVFSEHVIFDPQSPNQLNITGVVVDKGLSNELYDKKYLVVSATDCRAYYVPLSKFSETPDFESHTGSIVTVSVKKAEGLTRKSDDTIQAIAKENGGIYSFDAHLKAVDPRRLPEGVTPQSFVENHVKRMEALEARGLVQRIKDKAWRVPEDLPERITETAGKGKKNFVQVKLESMQSLEEQLQAIAPTWIDSKIATDQVPSFPALKSRFVEDLDNAKKERLEKLCEWGEAVRSAEGTRLKEGFIDRLYDLQMKEAEKDLSREHGTPAELKPGQSFTGSIRKITHLPSGPHVVVGDGRRFVMVPYQKAMDEFKGQSVTLKMANIPGQKIEFSAAKIERGFDVSR